ncbi:hypothetical protein N8D56_25525 (plasmid) [Devosia sp. A8/3-2]|nr:hypothetical protein N8D56_25525 [Devosia sp. A8/3-2]
MDRPRKLFQNLNASGQLNDRTIVVASADGSVARVTDDINGDGVIDETVVQQTTADGTRRVSSMDGAVALAGTREFGTSGGKYVTTSANGLTTTVRFDANGDGPAETQTEDVTVLNADGSKVQTVTNADLAGGDPAAENPSYTVTVLDRAVITTSANGRVVTAQWDLTGSGVFTASREDATTFGADGSTTQTTSYFSGSTLTSQFEVTTSGDGQTETTRWNTDGLGTFDEVSTKVISKNANGTTTETVTNTTFGGAPLSQTVTTSSADGRTVTVQEDPDGIGGFDKTTTTETLTLADGSTIVTVSEVGWGRNRSAGADRQ